MGKGSDISGRKLFSPLWLTFFLRGPRITIVKNLRALRKFTYHHEGHEEHEVRNEISTNLLPFVAFVVKISVFFGCCSPALGSSCGKSVYNIGLRRSRAGSSVVILLHRKPRIAIIILRSGLCLHDPFIPLFQSSSLSTFALLLLNDLGEPGAETVGVRIYHPNVSTTVDRD